MLQFLTCGESHGKYLTAILEGIPSGLELDLSVINHDLSERQKGYGRGGRQKIENDQIEITGGVYKWKTTGAPIGLMIENKDVKIEKGEPKLILYNWYKIVWPLLYLISRLDYLIPRKVEGGFIFLVARKIK